MGLGPGHAGAVAADGEDATQGQASRCRHVQEAEAGSRPCSTVVERREICGRSVEPRPRPEGRMGQAANDRRAVGDESARVEEEGLGLGWRRAP